MRILIVTQYFWPENFLINELARGLKNKGHEITVLTGIPNYPAGRFFHGYGLFQRWVEDYDGINVIRVPLIPRGKGGRLRIPANYLSFAFISSLVGPLRCGSRYDLIFVYEPSPVTVGLPAIVMKYRARAPIFFWVQDLWPESLSATGAVTSRQILDLVGNLVRFIYRKCDRILVQSRAFSSSIERLGVDPDRILYFPNSAENHFVPVRPKFDAPERSEMPHGFRVMFAGNIGAAQDFGTILGAAEMLKERPDIHWVILGDGRMRPWLEEQVRERGLSGTVHLLGSRSQDTMPNYFALADVMLVTLRKDPIFAMTIPSKLQSYLACGRPVVAALEGEGARVVEEAGAGFSRSPENPQALAEAVLAMSLKSATERGEMGLRGRRYFESHFESSMLLDRLDGWMREFVGKKEFDYIGGN
jgi:glycosyltransferase involved in cell wall biosynthesis